MATITEAQIGSLLPQQGDDLRALLARQVRARFPFNPVSIISSAARTVTTASSDIDLLGQDVAVFLDCTAAAGPSGIQLFLRGVNHIGISTNVLHSGASALTTTGNIVAVFRNGLFVTRNSAGGTITSGTCPLPSRVSFLVNHVGVDSYTYSVSYQILGR